MRILAFASIKGGVGKTTLAVHVAAAYADAGKRTLLLDLDPQGHATSMAGVTVGPRDLCVVDAMGATPAARLQDVIRETSRKNLWVAPANNRMATQERDLFQWGHRLSAIPRSLAALPLDPEVVVVDTPPQLNAYTQAALAAGDVVVVPVPAMAHALQGLDEIRRAWKDASDGRGGAMVIAVNLWDRRTTATNNAMDEAFKDLDVPLVKHRVLRAEALNQAGLAYELVYDFAPRSEISGCLRDLAKELSKLAAKQSRN